MPSIAVVRSVEDLRREVGAARASTATIGLVPTMGALHEGHLALVTRARREARVTIASIFVNPTQFSAGEDLSAYPRTLEDDLAQLERAGADIAFVPSAEAMYPPGFALSIAMAGPAKAGLEDLARPEHFGGVATVVAKLFVQSGANVAVFGEKDYQQLRVVTRLAADLDLPIRIVGEPTVREADGLALSSRNRFLSPQDRAAAPVLHRTLVACARSLRAGGHAGAILAEGREIIGRAGVRLDYLELRDALTLEPAVPASGRPSRLLVAGRLGSTRLIDNIDAGTER